MAPGSRVHLDVDYVRGAVGAFYRRMLADPALSSWFDDVDVASLRVHQTEFLLAALGAAPDQATRPERMRAHLRETHQGLGIDQYAFDRTASHLEEALRQTGMGAEQRGEAMEVLRGLAPYVVDVRKG